MFLDGLRMILHQVNGDFKYGDSCDAQEALWTFFEHLFESHTNLHLENSLINRENLRLILN